MPTSEVTLLLPGRQSSTPNLRDPNIHHPKWFPADAARAAKEGWGLFNIDTTPSIQRIDEDAVFATDDDAVAFVRSRARGMNLWARALSIANTTSTEPPSGQWLLWLAFRAGEIRSSPGGITTGRDALRELRARFDQMGAPIEEWPAIEKAVLQGAHAFSLSPEACARRAVEYLAGGVCPVGPLDHISG